MSNSKDRLPAGHGIGSNDRMHGFEDFTNVFWCTTFGTVYLESILLSCFIESGLGVGGSQRFEEFLYRCRNSVIDFIARRPKCIYSISRIRLEVKEHIPPPVVGNSVKRSNA